MISSLFSFDLTPTFLSSGFRPSHSLLLLLRPAEDPSQLCGRLLRDQQPLLPASCGVSINSRGALRGQGEGRIRIGACLGPVGGSYSRKAGLRAEGLTESSEKQVMKSPVESWRGLRRTKGEDGGFLGRKFARGQHTRERKKDNKKYGLTFLSHA